ncbi:MAG: hypothetical protein LH606_10440 [Cytophagaceae bacterium]|nr:hypothetical protein [Cytophagaceae bacterium]
MRKLLLALIVLGSLAGCRKETLEVNPAGGVLAGRYRVEADPIRCASPTSTWMEVVRGDGVYRFTYDRFRKGPYTLEGVEARKMDDQKYELWLNGARVGQYTYETMIWQAGKPKNWILSVRHDEGNPTGVEFMGVKE